MSGGKIIRTERHQFKDERMWELCRFAKNLYNRANYLIRNHYAETGEYLGYRGVYELVKSEDSYAALASQAAQSVLRRLDKNWLSFFTLRKKDPAAGIPKYKDKDGYFVWEYAGSKLSVKDGVIKLPKTDVKVKTHSKYDRILWLRIVPRNDRVMLEIVTERENDKKHSAVRGKALGVDIGVNNLAAMTSNGNGDRPCLVNGRPLKSINQFYNKEKARLKSICETVNKKKTSKRLKALDRKRNNKVDNYLHAASRMITDWCVDNGIETVVIGRNVGWKKNVKLGKRNNQNFTFLPTSRFVYMLGYKLEEYGINVIETEESYTSKCDHLSNEPMEHLEKRSGKRTKRGLFKSGTGITINADVNGTYGMLRKINAVDGRFFESIVDRGHVVWPVKLNIPY